MLTDRALLESIRGRIGAGRLPCNGELQIFGGKGDGAMCACCDKPITSTQVQYDIELRGAGSSSITLSMHLDCYEAWQHVAQEKVAATGAGMSARPSPLDGP